MYSPRFTLLQGAGVGGSTRGRGMYCSTHSMVLRIVRALSAELGFPIGVPKCVARGVENANNFTQYAAANKHPSGYAMTVRNGKSACGS